MFLRFLIVLIILLSCADSVIAEQNTSYVYPPWKHTWGVRRATPFKLRMFIGNKTKFDDPQGLACVRLDSWEDTTTTSDDDEVTVYGVNSGDNCIIYNSSMYAISIYGLDDNHTKFNRPWGIAANNSGVVYVVDRGNARVVKLFNNGNELEYVDEIGGPGDAPGKFIDPRGVAIDNSGRFYVTDAALGRVTVFDSTLQLINIWEGFIDPDGIAVIGFGDKWSYYPNTAFAVVTDSLHQRIRKLSLEGELQAEIHERDLSLFEMSFDYVAIDFHNQILATDSNNGCIHKFDRNLNYLSRFGRSGTGDYEFDEPRGIALHRHFGQIFISERNGAQYLWVAVDVPYINGEVEYSGEWRDLMVDFRITEPATCEIEVLDEYGRFLARIVNGRRFPAGNNHFAWGLKIPHSLTRPIGYPDLPAKYKTDEYLPSGKYILRGRFKPIYSSRKHFEREAETSFIVQ